MSETTFTENLDQKQMIVEREFNGPLELVWRAWTERELLDKWWAPAPWKTETKSMDFREGGRWLYSMNGPEDEQHWCRLDYLKIRPQTMYEAKDAFCDEEGNDNSDIPSMHWVVKFSAVRSKTHVDITISFQSEAALEKIVEMGFKEGFTAAHENLDRYLETQFHLRRQNKTDNSC